MDHWKLALSKKGHSVTSLLKAVIGLQACAFLTSAALSEPISPRILGDFADGKPVLTKAVGEARLSRIWLQKPSYEKSPYSARGTRFSLMDCVVRDGDGKWTLRPRADMGFSVLGALNLSCGSFSAWFQPGEIFKNGGVLVAGKGFPTGGQLSYTAWILGVNEPGKDDGTGGRLYFSSGNLRCTARAAIPLDGKWVHIAAVWNADGQTELFINGQVAGEQRGIQEASSNPALVSFQNKPSLYGECLVSHSTGQRVSTPLNAFKETPDLRIGLENKANGQILEINNKGKDRVQLRAKNVTSLPPGEYELVVVGKNSQAGSWNARLTAQSIVTSLQDLKKIQLAGTDPDKWNTWIMPFSLTGTNQVSIDLNIQSPGTYEVSDIAIRHHVADEGVASQESEEDKKGSLIEGIAPYPVDRMQIYLDPDEGIRNLELYDVALNAGGVAALYRGQYPDTSDQQKSVPDSAARTITLGWGDRPEQDFLKLDAERPLELKQAVVTEAKENLRAAGWLAVDGFLASRFPWWYHGYAQEVAKELQLKLDPSVEPNFITGAGGFVGSLQTADGQRIPLNLHWPWYSMVVKKGGLGTDFKIVQDSGELAEISFYQVTNSASEKEKSGDTLWLGQPVADTILPDWKRREFISAYPPLDRLLFPAVKNVPESFSKALPALCAWHTATEPFSDDYYLGGIGLRLDVSRLEKPTHAQLIVHDAFSPWRELARLNFELVPSNKDAASYLIDLDLRDTLITKGNSLWLTLTFDQNVTLAGGQGGTGLTLWPEADHAKVMALWRDWELRTVRDRFESLSEPRTWGPVSDDEESSWWLRAEAPEYEYMDRSMRLLRSRIPNDPIIESFFQFTHPQMPESEAVKALPDAHGAPQWAVLSRECLSFYKQFVDWWVAHRQLPNGEFGNFYGDDSDLVQDWLDLSLITDPERKYSRSLEKLSDGISTTFTEKGEPVITDGLNTRRTDVLHAYEEGVNVRSPDFLAHYGDPVKLQRLLDTASRYDGFLLTKESNGQRRFGGGLDSDAMASFDAVKAPTGGEKYLRWYLMTIPGTLIAWHNNNPQIQKFFTELSSWGLDVANVGAEKEPIELGFGATSFYFGRYSMTNDEKYLAPLLDVSQLKNDRVLKLREGDKEYQLFGLLADDYDKTKTLGSLNADDANRYDKLGTDSLGWADTRYFKNWAEWSITRDKSYLVSGLEALYRRLKLTMPALTVAEQSGDRVSPPKQLISLMYLGGIPWARNSSAYPSFAVSYEGLSDDFAALVLTNKKDLLEVLFYNFEDQALLGKMKVWNLIPGKYEMTAGPADEKDVMEKVESTNSLLVERATGAPLELPSKKVWLVRLKLVEKTTSLEDRVDAGVSSRLVHKEANQLVVPVFNTGVKAIPRLTVRLRSADGKISQDQVLEDLPANADWKLAMKEVRFPLDKNSGSGDWTIELDPDHALEEITRANNYAEFPDR